MRAWLKRLWAELRRDHIADHARARELFERAVVTPEQWDAALNMRPACPTCNGRGWLTEGPLRGDDCPACSPENSPEAVKPESRKSL